MTRKAIATLAAVLTSAGVFTAVGASPAAAETRYIQDAVGDTKTDDAADDVKLIRIGHGRDWVYLKATPKKGGFTGSFSDYWIDTVRGNPGPEFVVSTDTDERNNVWTVHRTDRFGQYGKAIGSGRIFWDDDNSTRFRVPRHLLKRNGVTPHRIRVAAEIVDQGGTIQDRAPDKGPFGPWVSVG